MLQVSQSKGNITPRGKFFPFMMPNGQWAEAITDEQYANVMVIKKEDTVLIWISLDAIGISEEFSDEVRSRLSKKFSVPIQNINLGYTHSHCAPQLGGAVGRMKSYDAHYLSYVADRIEDVTERCFIQGFSNVEVYVKKADGSDYYSNRNGIDKTGDKEIGILEFRNQKGEVKGLILTMACHSTVVNFIQSRAIHSDLAGYLCRGLEQRYGIYPLFILQAAGDMGNRCFRKGNDYRELIRIGDGLLKQMEHIAVEEKLAVNQIQVQTYQYKDTYVTTKAQRQKQITHIKEQISRAENEDVKRVFQSALEFAEKQREGGTFVMNVKGTILRMGDMEIVTMPAELFSCFGLAIKQAMDVKYPMFWGYSNYSVGYLYNKEEAGLTFESAATNIPAGVTEKICEYLCELVK